MRAHAKRAQLRVKKASKKAARQAASPTARRIKKVNAPKRFL